MPNAKSIIKEAVEMVAAKNPFGFTGNNIVAFYEHKMKVLLLDAALGMTPSKEWIRAHILLLMIIQRCIISRLSRIIKRL